MLALNNISIAYDDNIIIQDFSMRINKGEVVCIVGESGSGKTSLIKSIAGLLPLHCSILDGDILYNKSSLLSLSESQFNKLRGKEISIVFQDSGLALNPIRKIGKQFIQFILTHQKEIGKKEAYNICIEMLNKMNLKNPDNIMNSYTFQLSGGMRQRVGLAFALSLHPKFLLLDEPTSALDVTTQAQVIEEIIKLKDDYNTTILMITHNIPLAIYTADRIIVMKKGKIVEENKAFEIFKNPQHEYTKELIKNIPNFESHFKNNN